MNSGAPGVSIGNLPMTPSPASIKVDTKDQDNINFALALQKGGKKGSVKEAACVISSI